MTIAMETNLEYTINTISENLSNIDIDQMTRLQASSLMAEMRQRIHTKGLATDGNPIGTYTPGYMRTRQRHGRKEGDKVVLSLTRAMENSMVLIPIENGTGIGYTTAEQLQKAKWNDKRAAYGSREIFAPTENERMMVEQIAQSFIEQHMNK